MTEYDGEELTPEMRAYLERTRDAYAQDELNYFQGLIEPSKNLPPIAYTRLFGLFNKDLVLSYLNIADMRILFAYADIIFEEIRMYMPPEQLTAEVELELNNYRALFHAEVKRAYEGQERKLQRTTITQVSTDRGKEEKKGFWGKMFGGGSR